MNIMETNPMLTPSYQNPIQTTESEYKNIYWIKTKRNSDDPMSVLYKGQAPQKEQLLISFTKTISYIEETGTVILDFMNDGGSFAKLVPYKNNTSGNLDYRLWIPERQIGDMNKTTTDCGGFVMDPYFSAQKVCPWTPASVLILVSVILLIVNIFVLFGSLQDNLYSIYIPIGIFGFIILLILFTVLILPLFSKNGIQRTRSLDIFNLSDNMKLGSVYSLSGGCCKYSECLCEIECCKELDQYQPIALISIIMVTFCETQKK